MQRDSSGLHLLSPQQRRESRHSGTAALGRLQKWSWRGAQYAPGEINAPGQAPSIGSYQLVSSIQPPTSALITSPNRSQVWPLNLASCSCDIGAKLVAEVLSLMPGKRPPSSRSLRLAACFITFSRVRSSPQAFNTCSKA